MEPANSAPFGKLLDQHVPRLEETLRVCKKPRLTATVDFTKLPTTPCIVAHVELDDDVVTAVVHAREEIRAHKDVELDVSTNDDLQAIAIALGSKFIENYSEMAKLCDQLARIMGINRTAALGVNRGGAHTPRHQHSPMGVLNVATGKKLWRFWRPDAPFDCDPDFILTVYAGDMLWFPPGWVHEVFTLEGDVYAGSNVVLNVNWVTWCLPRHLAAEAMEDLFTGATAESQRTVRGRLSKNDRQAMSRVVDTWVAGGAM
eukprot:COSAG05_NODE_635_length_8192_cov_14.964043_4_plen_259_part_00